jgi:hypothetical protein
MGSIIYWGLLRFAVVLVSFWFLRDVIEKYGDWWSLFFVAIGVVVLYPAQLAYMQHREKVKQVNLEVICTSCKHYNRDEALCTALDQLVTSSIVPCEAVMWEPK